MGKFWCVVEFEDGVQIVPQIWINGDKCYWPTHIESQKSFEKAVKEYRQPNDSWSEHVVRIFGVYDSYELAVPKLKLAEIQSDLNTDDEAYKKSRAMRKRKFSSSEDEETVVSDEDIVSGLSKFPIFPKNKEGSTCYSTPKSTSSVPLGYSFASRKSLTPTLSQPFIGCCKFDQEYKNEIKNDLNEVKTQLKLVIQMLREQNGPAATQESRENFDDLENKLPMQSEEDVYIWETHLKDKDEQKKMISFLAHIGGYEINAIVKNILRKLLTDAVASFFNWEGKKGKKMFSSLIISDCIRKAAILSPNSKGATEQDVIVSIKNWLRHASARLNNSNKKKNTD